MQDYRLTSIGWLRKGVVAVQEAEALILNQRKGLATHEFHSIYNSEHLPETADRLKKLGIGLVVVQAFNNVGYESDNENMKVQKKMAGYLHERGIKVGAYVQTIGTVFYEGVMPEEKNVLDWTQKDYLGRRPMYYNSYFRYIPCINREEYLQYVEKGIRYAVENLEADLVFFDNYGYYSFACACDACRDAFREYLEARYPDRQAAMDRFGFSSVKGILPPVFADDLGWNDADPFLRAGMETGLINDPVQQEWIGFRCKRLGDVSARFSKLIKNISQDIAVVWNAPYMGPMGGLNNAVFHGIWPEAVYPSCDAFSAEADQGMLGAHEDGRMSTRIRTFKNGRYFKRGIWMTNFHRQNILLDLSESMAFNPFLYNTVGLPGLESLEPDTKKYIEFHERNRDLYEDTDIIPEAGILYSYASLSYELISPLSGLIMVEEVLIRSRIPYAVLYDRDLDRLWKYPVLILPNVKYMSSRQIEQIEKYVKDGGNLVVTGQTSLLDEHGRRRTGVSLFKVPPEKLVYGLEKVLGIKWPTDRVARGSLGKGRYVIIPEVTPCKENIKLSTVGHSIGPAIPYLKRLHGCLPENRAEILEALEWAGKGREVLRVKAPLTVTAELLLQEHTGRIMLHLVNYDSRASATGASATFKVPSGRSIKSLSFLTPESEEKLEVGFAENDGRICFDIPEFKIYGLVVME